MSPMIFSWSFRSRDIGRCVRFGILMATGYTLVAIGIYLARGSHPFEANEVTLPKLVGAYYLGGIMGGAVVGFLWPLLKWRIGATIVGILAAFPAWMGITLSTSGWFSHWTSSDWWGCVVLSLFVGGLAANLTWRRSSGPP